MNAGLLIRVGERCGAYYVLSRMKNKDTIKIFPQERLMIGKIIGDMYDTCINSFQEIRAKSATNLHDNTFRREFSSIDSDW